MEKNYIQDRIGEYLIPHLDEFVFDELSDSYLERAGLADILTDVPVPIRKTAMTNLSTLVIAQNMAFVVGCDVNFKYRDNYTAYIARTFTAEFAKPLINEGVEAAAKEDFDSACIYFRAALLIDPDSTDALYCYGRACRDAYERGEGEEYVGRFKAESLEAFEKLTLKKPDFDMGFYFLGYGYLNLGLYVKAKLTWETFMSLSSDKAQREEIQEFLIKLEEPVKIEEGYNHVLSGHYEEGIRILGSYENDRRFNTWWPLWYYLGVAYRELGRYEEAEARLREVLKLSPSNVEAMQALIEIYRLLDDAEKAEKYERKVKLVLDNQEKDRAEKNGNFS